MVNYQKKQKLQHHGWVITKYHETRSYKLPIVSQLLNQTFFKLKKKIIKSNPCHSFHFDKGHFLSQSMCTEKIPNLLLQLRVLISSVP